MRAIDYNGLSYRKMHVFVTVAENSSMIQAAVKLNLTTSAVSKIIQGLESDLGIQLLIRTPTGVTLTPAGRMLSEKWVEILRSLSASILMAHEIQEVRPHALCIGIQDSFANVAFRRAIAAFRSKYPKVNVRFSQTNNRRLLSGLLNKSLDVGITTEIDLQALDSPDLLFKSVGTQRTAIYLSPYHPLYELYENNGSVSILDFQSSHFIFLQETAALKYNDAVQSICLSAGFTPLVAVDAENIQTALLYLQYSDSVMLSADFLDLPSDTSVKKLYVREMEDMPVSVYLFWHRDRGADFYLSEFVRLCSEEKTVK